MKIPNARLLPALALLIASTGGVGQASAQTADVAGRWDFEVQTDQGTTTPSLTLEQDGENLTGHYSSEALGEADVTGTVRGSDVTITFTASAGGQSLPVTYAGRLGEDGKITGRIDIADGMMGGTFTATRAGSQEPSRAGS